VGISLVIGYLHLISFGRRHRYDAVLALQLTGNLQSLQDILKDILFRYCDRPLLASQQQLRGTPCTFLTECAGNPNRYNELRDTLQSTSGMEKLKSVPVPG
jgi:hypothetical protein